MGAMEREVDSLGIEGGRERRLQVKGGFKGKDCVCRRFQKK